MIRLVKRKDLEIEKYDGCIAVSAQSRIYAFSWYLDIVAENWDVLVLGDYEVVMPLPWKQKYFIKYSTQPFFCQQLGVFSKESLSEKLQEKMIQHIPKKFFKVALNFNSDNFLNSKMKKKVNHFLALKETKEVLFKSFSKGRKHAVKVGQKNHLIIKETSIAHLIEIQRSFYNYKNFSEEILVKIHHHTLEHKNGFLVGVYKEDLLLGGAFFLKSKNRIIYLFSSFTDDGKKHQASSFLINEVIERYAESNFILDFEGGNLPTIASFFKSFGAKKEEYQQLKYNNLSFLRKLFKS